MARPSKEINAAELPIQQLPDMVANKNGELSTDRTIIAPPEKGGLNKNYLDELAFMEEPIEVMVAESTDENADNPVQVGHNGTFFQFFRGVPTVCKRKFVDCLIAKSGRVSTPEVLNGGGERTRAIRQTSALKYPFSIIRDTNPKGAEWLRRRMAEAI